MKRSTSSACILPIALAVAACVPVPISELPLAAGEEPAPAALEEAMAPAAGRWIPNARPGCNPP